MIDPPNSDGTTTGDDVLIETTQFPGQFFTAVGEGFPFGPAGSFTDDFTHSLVVGRLIYLRAWDGTSPATSSFYGDSALYALVNMDFDGNSFGTWSTDTPVPVAGSTDQVITPFPQQQDASPDSPVGIEVLYTTSPIDTLTTGLGLRIHFDSSQLGFQGLANILQTGLSAQGAPEPDVSDFDNDPATDMLVNTLWLDLSTSWPGTGTTSLFVANFTSVSGFSGTTNVNFSSSASPTGVGFVAASATVDAASGIPTVSTWGMVVLTLMLVSAGTVVFARERAAIKAC